MSSKISEAVMVFFKRRGSGGEDRIPALSVESCGVDPKLITRVVPLHLQGEAVSFAVESPAFEAHAISAGLNMEQHPLHYLFLDPKTYAARQAWKAALQFAPPVAGVDLGPDKFRDPDHLAEWLGSLVDGNEQEEWDAAQAAMQGVRAFQGNADVLMRMQEAVEGECGGLSISTEQAAEILRYVLQPLSDDHG